MADSRSLSTLWRYASWCNFNNFGVLASSWVLPFFVLVPRCIWAVACIWLTQFVGCNNFEFRNNLSGVTWQRAATAPG